MNLYHRCVYEFAKPDVIEMHKNNLKTIPVSAKTAILSLLCKRGYFKDTSVLKHLVNSTVSDVDFGECVVTDDMLQCLHVCKNIRKLDLGLRRRQKRHITTYALMSLLQNFESLEVLIIPDCIEFNDDVVKVMCYNCKGLRVLNIQNSSISNFGLSIIGDLNSLCVINLSGTRINDRGIDYLVGRSLGDTLTEINIAKCPNLTAAASAFIGRKCRNLKFFTCGPNSEGTVHFWEMKEPFSSHGMKQVFWKS